jgi:hypothetical protein
MRGRAQALRLSRSATGLDAVVMTVVMLAQDSRVVAGLSTGCGGTRPQI